MFLGNGINGNGRASLINIRLVGGSAGTATVTDAAAGPNNGMNGVLVWDSLAIGEYLAEKQPALLPADPVARATARAVSAEMHAGFRDLRTHMPMNIRKDYRGFGRSPDVDEDIARIIAIWNDCRTRFGEGGPYLFGHFTLADAAFAPVCFRCKTYGLEVNGAAGDYLATMLANEHMQEWEAAARAETESIDSEDLYG